ncbi:MAG: aldo/keto reductase [Acidiferrobacter sp.]
MNYRTLPGTTLRLSDIGLGTMTFGEQTADADAHAQLDTARDAGINLIDMAEMYPVPGRAETQGASEACVGRWLHKTPRDQVVIATKVAGPSRGFSWIRNGPQSLDASNIRSAVEGSLTRLQTDYIDLYQIHWPARPVPLFGDTEFIPDAEREADATPVQEQLQALADIIKAGKIRYVGLSNETPWGVLEFLRQAAAHGLPRIVTIQNPYNLLNRTFEQGLAEICYREGLGLLAYSPLAFGVLTGKYLGSADPSSRLQRFAQFGQRYRKPQVESATRAYVELAERLSMPPIALALAFVRARFFTLTTLIGARTVDQLRANLDAACVRLDATTLAAIDRIHNQYPNPAP